MTELAQTQNVKRVLIGGDDLQTKLIPVVHTEQVFLPIRGKEFEMHPQLPFGLIERIIKAQNEGNEAEVFEALPKAFVGDDAQKFMDFITDTTVPDPFTMDNVQTIIEKIMEFYTNRPLDNSQQSSVTT